MGNTQKFLITVRFPSWSYKEGTYHTEHRGEGKDQYCAFGVKYLIEIPIEDILQGTIPEDGMTNEQLLNLLTEEQNVMKYFVAKWKKVIGGKWDGEILFVEKFNCAIL